MFGHLSGKDWLNEREWKNSSAYAWAMVCLSANLIVILYSHITWVATAVLLVPVFFAMHLRNEFRWDVRELIGPILFLFGVAVSTLTAYNRTYNLGEGAKLGIILLWGLPLFLSGSGLARAAFRGAVAVAWVNLGLLVAGLFGASLAARIMAAYRWGTILAAPGSLVFVGIIVFGYAAYKTLASKRVALKDAGLLLTSVALVFLDGALEGILALGIGVVFITVVVARERGWSQGVWAFAWLVIVIVAIGSISPSRARVMELAFTVQRPVVHHVQSSGAAMQGPGPQTPSRLVMLTAVVKAIARHPFYGTGLNSTKATTQYGRQVIHNEYLQIWADAGPVGLLGLLWTLAGWVRSLPRKMSNVLKDEDPKERAVFYGAVFNLLFVLWAGLFTPFSSEWSVWIVFLLGRAQYGNIE